MNLTEILGPIAGNDHSSIQANEWWSTLVDLAQPDKEKQLVKGVDIRFVLDYEFSEHQSVYHHLIYASKVFWLAAGTPLGNSEDFMYRVLTLNMLGLNQTMENLNPTNADLKSLEFQLHQSNMDLVKVATIFAHHLGRQRLHSRVQALGTDIKYSDDNMASDLVYARWGLALNVVPQAIKSFDISNYSNDNAGHPFNMLRKVVEDLG